jgi:hypothetical protein
MLVSDGSGSIGELIADDSGSSTGSGTANFVLFRDATEISRTRLRHTVTGEIAYIPPGCINHIDVPSAGTYTYKMQASSAGATNSVEVNRVKLVAFEL